MDAKTELSMLQNGAKTRQAWIDANKGRPECANSVRELNKEIAEINARISKLQSTISAATVSDPPQDAPASS